MRLPRFLWVPFELGRPFGAPHDPGFQRRVLLDVLGLLERTDGPVILEDFPDDVPSAGEAEPAWTCPVSYSAPVRDEQDLVRAVRREIAQLAPWAELAAAPTPISELQPEAIVDLLADATRGEIASVETLRFAADDIRTWYLHAAGRQPGRATSHERSTWFWRQTALARLLGRMAARLRDHPDPIVRLFADRAIVPRDHQDLLVHDVRNGAPDA